MIATIEFATDWVALVPVAGFVICVFMAGLVLGFIGCAAMTDGSRKSFRAQEMAMRATPSALRPNPSVLSR